MREADSTDGGICAGRYRKGDGATRGLTGSLRRSRVPLQMRAPWIAAAVLSCTARQMPPPAKLSVPAATPTGTQGGSAQLDSIARRYWTTLLETAALPLLGEGSVGGPLNATALGDHRFDAKLDDLSP